MRLNRVGVYLFLGLIAFFAWAQSPKEGLVASYAFEGNAADLSSNHNDAEVRGAALTEGHDGEAASAYRLDGKDDYLVVPHSKSLSLDDQATFSLWWQHEPQAAQDVYYTLFEKSDPERGGHSRYGMWLIGDLVEVCIEAPDNSAQNCLDSTGSLDAGWHHLAATFDGATLRVYLDGERKGKRAVAPSGISQSPFEIFIGTDQYAPEPVYTRGVIDELRLYDRMLSGQEIRDIAERAP